MLLEAKQHNGEMEFAIQELNFKFANLTNETESNKILYNTINQRVMRTVTRALEETSDKLSAQMKQLDRCSEIQGQLSELRTRIDAIEPQT